MGCEIHLNDEEIEWIKRICERAILFEEMGLNPSSITDASKCRALLKKIEEIQK